MRVQTALDAMRLRVCLGLNYDGLARTVEVHAGGVSYVRNDKDMQSIRGQV